MEGKNAADAVLDRLRGIFGCSEFVCDEHRSPTFVSDFGREQLGSLFHLLGYKIGAEIGVEQGAYSEVLLKANPGLKLFCVDSWASYSGYRDHVSKEKLEGFYRRTAARLKDHDAVLVRSFSADAARQFRRNSLDFVYVDANHSLPHVIQDINLWSEKVRPGGIVSGHDYVRYRAAHVQCHVVEAVHAWAKAYRISPWFVIGSPDSGHGSTRCARSWMWVKR